MTDDQLEDRTDSTIAAFLRVRPVALQITAIEQLRAEHREETASVEPVIARELGCGQCLGLSKQLLQEKHPLLACLQITAGKL